MLDCSSIEVKPDHPFSVEHRPSSDKEIEAAAASVYISELSSELLKYYSLSLVVIPAIFLLYINNCYLWTSTGTSTGEIINKLDNWSTGTLLCC